MNLLGWRPPTALAMLLAAATDTGQGWAPFGPAERHYRQEFDSKESPVMASGHKLARDTTDKATKESSQSERKRSEQRGRNR